MNTTINSSMSLNSHEFALMLDDLKPMPIIKQIMIYNKRSESKLIPEYLEMVININHNISNLFDDLFYCDENTSSSNKLKMYKRLLSLLDEIKSNFLKPMKFHPLTDIIDNFVIKFYNFNEKTSPISILYETVRNHILNENYLTETY